MASGPQFSTPMTNPLHWHSQVPTPPSRSTGIPRFPLRHPAPRSFPAFLGSTHLESALRPFSCLSDHAEHSESTRRTQTPPLAMNPEKLKLLQAQVRIGGKGTARRKKKVVHRTATTDDKKLQSSLKKLAVNSIPGIEEVNMIKDDGSVIHFNNPKVQASLAANTFAVTGHAENKQVTELLPGILNQLGAESLNHLKKLASSAGGMDEPHDDDDDVPELVENFDEASKNESKVPEKDEEDKENQA